MIASNVDLVPFVGCSYVRQNVVRTHCGLPRSGERSYGVFAWERRASSLHAFSGLEQSEQLVEPSSDVRLASPPQEPVSRFLPKRTPMAMPIMTKTKTARASPKTVRRVIQFIDFYLAFES